MKNNKLIQMWQLAAQDLRIEIIAPFVLILSSGINIEAKFLLKQFGGRKGMIVVDKYDQVANYVDEIINKGYGFSVLDEPNDSEEYIRSDFIDILSDWGWSGNKSEKPTWLRK